MEIWRTGCGDARRPKVLGARNLSMAFALHAGCFVLLWLYAALHGLFATKEEIVPIDLTVVVNENLDGEENEPPPLRKPDPPPPPEPPRPRPRPKEPEKPKELERIVTNVVARAEQREEQKPERRKAPEPPRKTAKELREERIRRMRDSAKAVSKPVVIEVRTAPSGNGRTAKKTLSDAEIRRRLMMGYKPGSSEQLAQSDLQLGYSLIKTAFEAKWDKPPWTDALKPMTIRVWFGGGGRVVNFRLEASSGDARADQSIKSAASRVGSVPGLPAAFIDKYRSSGVPVRFTVRPE